MFQTTFQRWMIRTVLLSDLASRLESGGVWKWLVVLFCSDLVKLFVGR